MKDRIPLVENAFAMGKQLSDTENVALLSNRWTSCLRQINEREVSLKNTERSAQRFDENLQPLSKWLQDMESLQLNAAILPVAESNAIQEACSKHTVGTYYHHLQTE